MSPSQPKSRPKAIVVDDDPLYQQTLSVLLGQDFELVGYASSLAAEPALQPIHWSLALIDIDLETPGAGLKFIPRFREAHAHCPVIVVSGRSDFATVREALRCGATDYVPKDAGPEELRHAIARSTQIQLLKRENQLARAADERRQESATPLVGQSAAIQSLLKLVRKAQPAALNVLITGETGTGKELIARMLRRRTNQGLEPFVAIDSATIQGSMAESILFGHEKGAYTGADATRIGLFEEADGGTVFFDEIANMPLDIQSKLLRVVQEREFRRLGGRALIQSDFRVICATNRDLSLCVKDGRFLPDLLQRLNVFPLEVPPLRSRREDIPLLAQFFLDRAGQRMAQRFSLEPEALADLERYDWPGNVRELAHTIDYMTLAADSSVIGRADLPVRLREIIHPMPAGTPPPKGGRSFYEQVRQFERELLTHELIARDFNVSQTALALGMDRSHLHAKIKALQISSPD